MTHDEAVRIVDAELRKLGWTSGRTPTVDDTWSLNDGAYRETIDRTKGPAGLRAQVREWFSRATESVA